MDLIKGQRISLTKDMLGMGLLRFGLGWDTSKSSQSYDPDACLLLIPNDGNVDKAKHLLYFNSNKNNGAWMDTTRPFPFIYDGAAASVLGDDTTGGSSAEGDDERIEVDLSRIPADIAFIVPFVVIYEAGKKKQHFGEMENCYVRIDDSNGVMPAAKFSLDEDFSTSEAVIFGYCYRKDGEWQYNTKVVGVNEGSFNQMPDVFNVADHCQQLLNLAVPA